MKVANYTIRARKPFSPRITTTVTDKATCQQPLRIPFGATRGTEWMCWMQWRRKPVEEQSKHPLFIEQSGRRHDAVCVSTTRQHGANSGRGFHNVLMQT